MQKEPPWIYFDGAFIRFQKLERDESRGPRLHHPSASLLEDAVGLRGDLETFGDIDQAPATALVETHNGSSATAPHMKSSSQPVPGLLGGVNGDEIFDFEVALPIEALDEDPPFDVVLGTDL
jgi:hypothetical protein